MAGGNYCDAYSSLLVHTLRGVTLIPREMIDWQAMRSEEDAEVCIFRIATSYSAPADMARWFEIQGFDADIIAIPGSNLPAIVAVWLVKEQGVLFSSNIFDRWWKSLLVHSISASVTYDENNLVTNSGIGFSAL